MAVLIVIPILLIFLVIPIITISIIVFTNISKRKSNHTIDQPTTSKKKQEIMSNCVNCGTKNNEADNFCISCGAELARSSQIPQQVNPTHNQYNTQN